MPLLQPSQFLNLQKRDLQFTLLPTHHKKKDLACSRQSDASRYALEERSGKLAFEAEYLPIYGGGRQVEMLGGLSNGASAGHLLEAADGCGEYGHGQLPLEWANHSMWSK